MFYIGWNINAYIFIVNKILLQPPCKLLYTLQKYFRSTTYFWMLVEGINVFIPLIKSFQKNISMVWLYFIGWGRFTRIYKALHAGFDKVQNLIIISCIKNIYFILRESTNFQRYCRTIILFTVLKNISMCSISNFIAIVNILKMTDITYIIECDADALCILISKVFLLSLSPCMQP